MIEDPTATPQRHVRVLVVDDNPHVLSALVDVLDEEPGVNVVGAALRVDDAIALAEAHRPDVVLADMNMPGGGGPRVVSSIRKTLPDVRIVALSALLADDQVSRVLAAGADSCLPKTIDLDSLLRSLTPMTPTPERQEKPLPRPHDTVPRQAASVWRAHRLSTLIVASLLAVISAAAFLVLRNGPEQGGRQLVATSGTSLTSQLYVDPNSQATTWLDQHQGNRDAQAIQQKIAAQPTGKWFGAWSGDITSAVSQYVTPAAQAGKIPVLVAYNLPGRDCGGFSSGGLNTSAEYKAWISGFAKGLADHRAIVVLEPDALAQLDSCLSPQQQQERLKLLSFAVDQLESQNVWVYLDAGHANWVPAAQMADRLSRAGVARAHGFSLNVSNYDTTANEEAYAGQLNQALGMSKSFVIDTSRNGNGSSGGEWCNPAGRKLGETPRMIGDKEMLLWVKAPGESDGSCGIAPTTAAGQFSPSLAMDLIKGS